MKHVTVLMLLALFLAMYPVHHSNAQEPEAELEAEPETEAPKEAEAEPAGPELNFGLGLNFGVQSYSDSDGEVITFQALGFVPELTVGKFGVGFDLLVHYRFTGGNDGTEFEVRDEDWEAEDFSEFLEVYLPKIRYIRWARKGDPIYARLGGLDAVTLGNGFIVGGYRNTLFRPDLPIFGAEFDLDGAAVGFPYLGMESFIGNLAAFDLFGGRVYARPLLQLQSPILSGLQLGFTAAADRDPSYFLERDPLYDETTTPFDPDEVVILGGDLRLPLLAAPPVSLNSGADVVVQDGDTLGGQVGLDGRALQILLFRSQLRVLGDNFIPSYFDSTYDLFRPKRYRVYSSSETERAGHVGYLIGAGISLFQDVLVFQSSLEGPFGNVDGVQPTLRAELLLTEGIVPGVSISAEYIKEGIKDLDDLGTLDRSRIGSRLNYRTGPAVISLFYQVRHDPLRELQGDDPWTVRSGLESTIALN